MVRPPWADPGRGLFSISVAAELTGLHPHTLRLYEHEGLLAPARSPGGARRYSTCRAGRDRELLLRARREMCESGRARRVIAIGVIRARAGHNALASGCRGNAGPLLADPRARSLLASILQWFGIAPALAPIAAWPAGWCSLARVVVPCWAALYGQIRAITAGGQDHAPGHG